MVDLPHRSRECKPLIRREPDVHRRRIAPRHRSGLERSERYWSTCCRAVPLAPKVDGVWQTAIPVTPPAQAQPGASRPAIAWMSDRLTSCGTSCQTTTREGALARLRYWCARRPAAAAAARRGLALYQLDMACFAAGRRGREVRRVDRNPHYPSYDLNYPSQEV